MEYNQKMSKDFINRTRIIIKQYDQLDKAHNEKYEITLKINCLYGLIIIPKAACYNEFDFKIKTEDASMFSMNLDEEIVRECEAKVFFHCIRNGLAHWMEKGNNNLSFKYKDGEIYLMSIEGTGEMRGEKHLLKVEINIENGGLDLLIDELHNKLNKNFK